MSIAFAEGISGAVKTSPSPSSEDLPRSQIQGCKIWPSASATFPANRLQEILQVPSKSLFKHLLLRVPSGILPWVWITSLRPRGWKNQNARRGHLPSGPLSNVSSIDLVIGWLYSVQYKRIFGATNKVRCDTCDDARLLSQVWGVEPNTSSGYEVAEPPHHHHIIAGMQDCIPT